MAYNRDSFASYAATSGSQGHDPNEFMRLSQAIGTNVQKITQNVQEMTSLLNQYGTRTDSAQIHDKLHQVQHYTNQLAKDTGKCVKDLSRLPPPASVSEQRQQKLQQERLVNEFSKALASFQAAQRQEKEKEKCSIFQSQRPAGGASKDFFADSPPAYKDAVDDDVFIGGQRQITLQVDNSDVELEIVREREEAMRKLETDIMDVNQIFKDLGMLVHEQGDVIDSIEANVETAAVSVEQGTEQLRQARQHQSSARKKKCICITVLLVVVAIIIIILCATLIPKK